MTLVPRPSLLFNSTCPPCCSAVRRTTVRPSPMPLSFVVNRGSNAFARFCGAIPSPVSEKTTVTPSAAN